LWVRNGRYYAQIAHESTVSDGLNECHRSQIYEQFALQIL